LSVFDADQAGHTYWVLRDLRDRSLLHISDEELRALQTFARRIRGERAGLSPRPRGRELVEKHIEGCNSAVVGDDEIGSGVLGRFAWRAGHPTDPSPIADLLGRRDRLVSEVGMSSLDLAGDAVDFIAAAMRATVRVVEHTVFMPDLVDRLPPAHWIDLSKDVTKVAQ
jgi:hypothetical protein